MRRTARAGLATPRGCCRAIVGVALVVLSAVGCTTDEPDVTHLEQSLATVLHDQIGALPELDCSSAPLDVAAGNAIECLATVGRSVFPVSVQATDSRDQAIASVPTVLIDASSVAELVGTRLSAELDDTTIDCGGPIVAADQTGVVSACTATDSSGIVRGLELSLSDEGAVKVELGSS